MPCVGELEADFPFACGVPGVGELSPALPLEIDVRVPMNSVEEGGRVNLPIDGGVFLETVGDLTVAVELMDLECLFDENVVNLEIEVKGIVRVCLCDVENVEWLDESEDDINAEVREEQVDGFGCVLSVNLDKRNEFFVLIDGVDDLSLVNVVLVRISGEILEVDIVAK